MLRWDTPLSPRVQRSCRHQLILLAATRHVDFLQLRSGFLHILDYKPEARKEKHAVTQLTIYSLALSRRTGLPVKAFKCASFDECDCFEFFPLPAIYPGP